MASCLMCRMNRKDPYFRCRSPFGTFRTTRTFWPTGDLQIAEDGIEKDDLAAILGFPGRFDRLRIRIAGIFKVSRFS